MMDIGVKRLLNVMLARRYIGGKHIPEKCILRLVSHHIEDKKEFEIGYRRILNDTIVIRVMKRTGKGNDWHISINPRKIKTAYAIIGGKK